MIVDQATKNLADEAIVMLHMFISTVNDRIKPKITTKQAQKMFNPEGLHNGKILM